MIHRSFVPKGHVEKISIGLESYKIPPRIFVPKERP
jgi:hypothetical protein